MKEGKKNGYRDEKNYQREGIIIIREETIKIGRRKRVKGWGKEEQLLMGEIKK